MRILRNTVLHKRNEFRLQERKEKMTCKVQLKPIKNNPLAAKLKAKKKSLKVNSSQNSKDKNNNNQ